MLKSTVERLNYLSMYDLTPLWLADAMLRSEFAGCSVTSTAFFFSISFPRLQNQFL
jgi:hypothetical protein